jgi:hypothetical protein
MRNWMMGVLVVGDQQRRKSVKKRQMSDERDRAPAALRDLRDVGFGDAAAGHIAPAVLRGRPGTRVQHAIGSASFWRYSLEPR